MERQIKIGRKYSSMFMKSVLALLLVLCPSGVKATEITTTVDGADVTLNYTLTTNGTNNMAVVARSTDLITTAGTNLTIPAMVSYDGTNYSVTSIGDSAFYDCSNIYFVTIPKGVTSIGMNAFRYCDSLVSVTMPESVTNIGKASFSFCKNLVSITVAKKNTTYSSEDGILFRNVNNEKVLVCFPANHQVAGTDTATTSYEIPSDVTGIGDYAFNSCNNLQRVMIPESVKSIGEAVFFYSFRLASITVAPQNPVYSSVDGVLFSTVNNKKILVCFPIRHLVAGTDTVTTSYAIPSGVTDIGEDAFAFCTDLRSVTIPNSVTSIGDGAFVFCIGLRSVTIPNSVTSVGRLAFLYCLRLKSLTIPNSMTSIGEEAFSITGITNLTIPENVTSIGKKAFSYCDSLQSVTIPNSVTSIGAGAFKNCTSLSSVSAENPNVTLGSGAFSSIAAGARLYVPKSRENADGWSNWEALTKTIRSSEDSTTRNDTLVFTADVPLTRYYHYPMDIPAGVTAYTGALNKDKTKLYLTQIKTAYLPAGTPAILYGKGTVTLTESAVDAYTAASGNDLSGSIIPTYFGEAGKALMLGQDKADASQYGFYNYGDDPVPANRAYLLASLLDGAQGVIISMGDPTNIKNVNRPATTGSDKVYNIDGTPEKNPKTGTVYIVNGKRIIYIK